MHNSELLEWHQPVCSRTDIHVGTLTVEYSNEVRLRSFLYAQKAFSLPPKARHDISSDLSNQPRKACGRDEELASSL